MYVQNVDDPDGEYLNITVNSIPRYWDWEEPSMTYSRGCVTMVAGQLGSAVKGTYKYRWRTNDCLEERNSVCLIRKRNENAR